MAGLLGDINNYLGVMADDTCIRTSLHVSDGIIMEGDRLVFCFPNMCALLLCDMDGLLAEIILLDGTPHFLTAVNGNTIAVAMTTNETVIEFYNTNTRDKVNSIRINQELRHLGGLATLDGKLVLGVNEQLVFIDYMTNQEVKTTKLSFNPTIIHVAEDMVYTSGRNTNFLPYTNDSENLLGYNYRTDVETTIRVTSPITSLTSLGDRGLYMICEDGSLFHVSAEGASKKKIPRDQLDIQGKCPIIRYSVMQKKLLAFDKHTGNVQIFHEI